MSGRILLMVCCCGEYATNQSTMNDALKYACPHCGADGFCTMPNAYDIYEAIGDKLFRRQKSEYTDEELELYCRECGERAPLSFEENAQDYPPFF